MDEQKLERLRALAEKATPGPWIAAAKPSSVVGWPVVSQTGRSICSINYVGHSKIDPKVPGDWAFNQQSEANAQLIGMCDPAFIIELIEAVRARPEPWVSVGCVSESNGKKTWVVTLYNGEPKTVKEMFRGFEVYHSALENRARYEAERYKHFFGQAAEPDLLAFPDPPSSTESEG